MGFIERLRAKKAEEEERTRKLREIEDERDRQAYEYRQAEKRAHDEVRGRARVVLHATSFGALLKDLQELSKGMTVNEVTYDMNGIDVIFNTWGTPDSVAYFAKWNYRVIEGYKNRRGRGYSRKISYDAMLIEGSSNGWITVKGRRSESILNSASAERQEAALEVAYLNPIEVIDYEYPPETPSIG